MNKSEFIIQLRHGLSGFPKEDVKRTVEFYSESIDDRLEEGMREEEAVAAMGSVEEIRRNCMEELPLTKLVRERIKPQRKLAVWEILLIVLGAPIWVPLIVFSLLVVSFFFMILLALAVGVGTVVVAVFASSLAGFISSPFFFFSGAGMEGLFRLGLGLLFAGLGILLALFFKVIVRGIFAVARKTILWIKGRFIRKGKEE